MHGLKKQQEKVMIRHITSVLLVISLALFTGMPAFASQDDEPGTMHVVGSGKIKVKPDTVHVDISVITEDIKASNAIKQNAEITTEILKKIKSMIGKNDTVETSSFELEEKYKYNRSRDTREFIGYVTLNKIQVKTKNISKLGTMIDSAVELGARKIEGPWFNVSNREKYKEQVLRAAVRDAKETARIVAESSGVKIVRILTINPDTDYRFSPPTYRGKSSRDMSLYSSSDRMSSASTPIESGDITITANVRINYAIR